MWSLVEMDLANLFAALAKSNPHELFGAVISFETRLAMCDRLMALSPLDEPHQELWVKLSARLSKFYKKRHELAHFTVGTEKSSGKSILQPFLTTATIRENKRRSLTAKQINERTTKFEELADALVWFSKFVVRCRMPLQAPRLPPLKEPPLVARLRELAALSLEERKRQPPDPQD